MENRIEKIIADWRANSYFFFGAEKAKIPQSRDRTHLGNPSPYCTTKEGGVLSMCLLEGHRNTLVVRHHSHFVLVLPLVVEKGKRILQEGR